MRVGGCHRKPGASTKGLFLNINVILMRGVTRHRCDNDPSIRFICFGLNPLVEEEQRETFEPCMVFLITFFIYLFICIISFYISNAASSGFKRDMSCS